MKKGGILRLLIIFAVIEIILLALSGFLNNQLQIGFNEDGKFVFGNTPHEFVLSDRITEDFQRDKFIEEKGEEKVIYGSEELYNAMTVLAKGTPVSTFQLLRMLLIVDLVLLFIALFTRKRLFERPSKIQVAFESIYGMLEGFVVETLGPKLIGFTPYIVTIFIFLWICNIIGMIPIPGFMEPTRTLNVTMGMGIMVGIVVHATAIKHKGVGGYLKGYLTPMVILDVIGELAKVVSISFRLFGNILGGAIIILVVSSLVKFVVLPVGLNMFFGLFVGTVQAFVFTMLALSYISVAISE